MNTPRCPALLAAAILGVSLAAARPALADDPIIDLAPEHKEPKKEAPIGLGAGTAPDSELVRGLTEQRFRSASESSLHTSVGGYGEIHVRGTTSGRDGEREWTGDLARMVLFVAHPFNDRIRAYAELEVEHAVACPGCRGEVGFEQAYVDWKLFRDKLGLRAGLVLVPMGIINQWHEPPVFHGVIRPHVETVVIPSTWRELGAGFFGEIVEGLHYELYAMTGLEPLGLSAGGIAGARQGGSFAAAKAWAATGRLEYEPLLGFVIGASGYATDAGANAKFYLRDHSRVSLSVPVLGFSADARFRRAGLEWRMLYAEWHLPQAESLMHTFDVDGHALFPSVISPVPTRIRGAYIEGAYDVFHPFGLSHQLLPFARLEFYDTQSAVPDGYAQNPTFSVREYTFGASYRPIQQLVFKGDYQLRNRKLGKDETQVNFGVGFMY